MKLVFTAFAVLFVCRFATAQEPPAEPAEETLSALEIMKRVAANQDRAEAARSQFVYEENIRVVSRRGNGKLAREERAEFTVIPSAAGVDKKRTKVEGRYWDKGRYQTFDGEPIPEAGTLDGGLVASMREDLTNEKSKDGIGKDLFPLTSEEQKDLDFELEGENMVGGRPAYQIRFKPKNSSDLAWAGEAVIDKEEFEPISVYTRLSRRLPLFVRAVFGTDVPGLGFNTHYKRLDKGVWFPDSFGTEFRIHALFFINRNISVSMENKNFKRTTVDAQIHYQ